MAQRRSLGILPRGLDKRTRLSEQEGDQHHASPQLRLTADMLPLPLGEGWGEGNLLQPNLLALNTTDD
ncbi:hypothetical protein AHML_15685 [Aeromonas hydrophila ML09-119]|nr:hypothetical protein AHML_15685 [Aeromonas hydrophila ML09-119]